MISLPWSGEHEDGQADDHTDDHSDDHADDHADNHADDHADDIQYSNLTTVAQKYPDSFGKPSKYTFGKYMNTTIHFYYIKDKIQQYIIIISKTTCNNISSFNERWHTRIHFHLMKDNI